MRIVKLSILIQIILFELQFGQQLGVGDYIPGYISLPYCSNNFTGNDSLNIYDFNGDINESGEHFVIWLVLFSSWWPNCQSEAPVTESIFQEYQDSNLVIIGIGADWNQPYSCAEWTENFGLTYPILDDSDLFAWSLFGSMVKPHNVIINHEMKIVYSNEGFAQNQILNSINSALNHLSNSLKISNIDPEKRSFKIHQNYPNPFNPVTTIAYELSQDAIVKITIYDTMGKIINNLVQNFQTAGHKSVLWNSMNNKEISVSAGLYIYTLEIGHFKQTKKMVLLKWYRTL